MRDDTGSKSGQRDQAEPGSTAKPARTCAGVGNRDAWRVVRTGARREKIVARQCGAAGITHFLPVVRVARDYAGTACRVEVPLLAGYLFARADEATLRAADASDSIREVVDAPHPATGWQLHSLARALDRDAPLEPTPKISNGRRVEVREVALAGVQGLVQDPRRAHHLVIQVDALNVAFSTTIGSAALAPVDPEVSE